MEFFGIIAFALLGIIINAIKILREYERGVVFQLGRFWKVKGPGNAAERLSLNPSTLRGKMKKLGIVRPR